MTLPIGKYLVERRPSPLGEKKFSEDKRLKNP